MSWMSRDLRVPMDIQFHSLRWIPSTNFLTSKVSRAAVSSTRMLWSERVSDPSITFRYMFSAPLIRYLSRRVPQEFAIARTVCVSHHRWRSLICCILSVLYVWTTIMRKISIISYFIGSQPIFSMITAFMIFRHYFLSECRRIVISHE